MASGIFVKAPAKINLTLDITGKREDGYHFLKMIMQSIDLFDTIHITQNSTASIQISHSNPQIPTDEEGLCHKAANAFFAHTGIKNAGIAINVTSRIPIEAGLGGGSADAAGVLVGLNQLYGTALSVYELCTIGVKIGADVPFCIAGGTMLAEGIGEIFSPLPTMPDCYILIAKPAVGEKTADCFARFDAVGSGKIPPTDHVITALMGQNLNMICDGLCNVLESVCTAADTIQQIKATMIQQGALGASMTGSGTAVFGVFNNAFKARKCARSLATSQDFIYLAKPILAGAHTLQQE